MNWLRRLLAAERGSIAVISALALTSLVGMSGLAVELGSGYTAKVRNQRVADMAALGAALAYGSSGKDFAVAQKTAIDMGAASGVTITAADVTLVSGSSAIQVVAHTDVPVKLAKLISQNTSFTVASSAVASVSSGGAAGCINVLGAGDGITISGGTTLTPSACAIANNGSTNLSGGSQINSATQVVTTATSVSGGSSINTAPTANNITVKSNAASDPFADNAKLKEALCQVNMLTGLSDPDYAGGNRSCTSGLVKATKVAAVTGQTWTFSGSPSSNVAGWRINNGADYVVPSGTYVVDVMNVSDYVNVTFQGPVSLTVNTLNVTGSSTLTLPDGPVTVTGALSASGSTTVRIGNGAHSFGSIDASGSSKVIGGSGNLNVSSKINVSGQSETSFAVAAGETIAIGRSAAGDGIASTGSSTLKFVPSGSTPLVGSFNVAGNITAGGQSGIVLPKATTHYIDGDFDLSGGGITTLNAGLYVAKGNFTISGGGTMTGVDVSVVMGGAYALSGGTTLNLAASATSAGSGMGIPDIVVATKSNAATTTSGGASTLYSGVLYLPKSTMTTSGGSGLSANGSSCMTMVVNKLTMSGGSNITAKACTDLASSSGGSVALIR